MFGKVKKWLGIEGVKLQLIIPEEVEAIEGKGTVSGSIRFFSKNTQKVTYLRVVMIEKYTRGRKDDQRTDEYELGEIELSNPIDVPAEQAIEIKFTLPFEVNQSEMDELGNQNILMGGLIKTAKWWQNVDSEFRILAEARVEGTALDPFDQQNIKVT